MVLLSEGSSVKGNSGDKQASVPCVRGSANNFIFQYNILLSIFPFRKDVDPPLSLLTPLY